MTTTRVPLRASWRHDDERPLEEAWPAELEVAYDGATVSIHGLRPGRQLSLDFVDLLAAVVTAEPGLPPAPPERLAV